jgi:hypothetical protein
VAASSPYEADWGPEDRCYECGAPLPELVPRVVVGDYNVNSYCCLACQDINVRRTGAGPGYHRLATIPVESWPTAPRPFVRCVCGRMRRAGTRGLQPLEGRDCLECYLPLRKGTA